MTSSLNVQLPGASFTSDDIQRLVSALNAPAKPPLYVLTKKRPPFRRKRLKG